VETPFFDAAPVFAPQKGATPAQVALLSRRLEKLAEQYRDRTGVDVTTLTGAGAAGGLAGGLAAIGAELVPGFEAVAEAVGLEAAFENADLVVTGEGKLDASSLAGKVVGGVLAWADDLEVAHVGVIAGQVTDEARTALAARTNTSVLALTDRAFQEREAYDRAALLAEEAAIEVARVALGKPAS
ncbi:MAG TPA: glycerate kinase, partial [Acidimicrobiia bacterium]|nr:glycerate kinase [Acidimicrobiia bacterium]